MSAISQALVTLAQFLKAESTAVFFRCPFSIGVFPPLEGFFIRLLSVTQL
jgi:hypothetical protein